MSELPEGWVRGSLSDVLRIRNGYAFKSAEFKLDGVPLVRQSNLDGDKVDLSKCAYLDEQYLIERASFTLHKGDVLIGMSGSVGKLCTYDQDFAALQNQRVGKIELHAHDQTEWRFVWHYLKTVTDALLDKAKGVAVANVSPDDIHSLPLNVPPLAEQTRIAQKLDELLAQVDTLKARIDAIPALLKRFRQSVLAAAVSGRLTDEWRMQHVGWVNEVNPTAVPNHGDDCRVSQAPPNLRAGWQITKLSELCTLVTSGSRGWADYYSDVGAIFIRSQDINTDDLNLTDTAFVTLPDSSEGKRTRVQAQDILITITGANVGKVARVKKPLPEAYVSQHVALLRLQRPELAPFIEIYLKDIGSGRGELTELAYGGGKPGLNLSNIRELVFTCPAQTEQTEIIHRVEQLFAFADQLEAKVASAKSRIDHLTQSILAKAFRGELVPQDPNDEPASVLLERIKTQRAAAPKAKRGKKATG